MSIKVDSRLLYLQVIDRIKQEIKCGHFKENERLPSENELAKMMGVSRATLREALRVLEEENIVKRKHGVGTFVHPQPLFSSGIEQLTSITSLIEQSGKKAGSTILKAEHIVQADEDCAEFAPRLVGNLIQIERVRTANNKPVVFCIDKIPSDLIDLEVAGREESLFELMDVYADKQIAYAVSHIDAIGYEPNIYNVLDCPSSQPLLLLKQMHYTDYDEPVLYSVNYFRTDMVDFHLVRKRM
ncbi:GntR family transcriptional regulator [Lentibacillus saliphilus]|uniref:GntR family transcriptional regulator n=1 Tax=Lentibacillus saliphilus TaxID=2737028 RepID=UPI001C310086|nr:GntR family transcriptional regulator [Lentibacillus saliphilus]